MIYAFPYILLAIFFGILAIIYHQTEDVQRRLYIKVGCLVSFLFFFGFRGFIYYDWTSYYRTFYAYPELQSLLQTSILKWEGEPGFVLLGTVCKAIFPNYHFFVFICSTINTLLLARFFNRYSDNLPLGFLLFVTFNGIVLSTDLMRNSIAILLFINSVQFIYERRPVPYYIVNLLAIAFHSSALLFLPLYFFLHRRYNKWLLMGIFGAANVMFLLHIPILKTIISFIADFVSPSVKFWLEMYTKMDLNGGFGIGLGYLERLLTGTLLFCYIDKLRALRPNNDIFINSVILYLILFLVFNEFRTVSMRLSNLFSLGYWIIWADLIKCFSIRNNRLLYVSFMGIYCLLRIYGNCHVTIAEYDNILLGAKSYNERLLIFYQHSDDDTGI